MEKATKRMAFNFLRSYFDVFNELETDEDKLSFISAIINKQFLDEDPEGLNFIVNLCYKSQKHAIEASVKGWKRANKTDMQGNPMTNPPTNPTTNTPTNPKEVQEKEKEKEKEQLIITTSEIRNIETKIDNSIYSKSCITDSQWLEILSMQTKVSEDATKLFISHFEDHLITMQEQKKNVKDFKNHFVHWFKKQDLSHHRTKVIGRTNQV